MSGLPDVMRVAGVSRSWSRQLLFACAVLSFSVTALTLPADSADDGAPYDGRISPWPTAISGLTEDKANESTNVTDAGPLPLDAGPKNQSGCRGGGALKREDYAQELSRLLSYDVVPMSPKMRSATLPLLQPSAATIPVQIMLAGPCSAAVKNNLPLAVSASLALASHPEIPFQRPPELKEILKYGATNPMTTRAFNPYSMLATNPHIGQGFGFRGPFGTMSMLPVMGPSGLPPTADPSVLLGPWNFGRTYHGGRGTGTYVGLSDFPFSSRMWHRGAMMGGAGTNSVLAALGTKDGPARLREQTKFIEAERQRAAIVAENDLRREQELGRAEMQARENQMEQEGKAAWNFLEEEERKIGS